MTDSESQNPSKVVSWPVILAAAGRSRRYGRPKLLETIPGTDQSLIQHVIQQLIGAGAGPIVAVLGPETSETYDWIGNQVQSLSGIALHIEPHPEEMRDSIVAGIQYLERWLRESNQPDPTHILFTPCDLPNMNLSYVSELIRCCKNRTESLLRGLTPEGRGIHPVALAWKDRHWIDLIPTELGLKELWKFPELSRYEWEWHDTHGHLDLDNPQDWKNFRQCP
jgi:CTP:molybdopterin cytidylyltransferase MocA